MNNSIESTADNSHRIKPEEVFWRYEDEKGYFDAVLASFGDGVEGQSDLLNHERLVTQMSKTGRVSEPEMYMKECMRQMRESIFPYLNDESSYRYQIVENLVRAKLGIELLEVKRKFLTHGVVGKRVEKIWREEHAQEIFPGSDEETKLVFDLAEKMDQGELESMKMQYDELMREWAAAIKDLDLAIRELQLKPGETVQKRVRFMVISSTGQNGYDRSNVV